MNFLGLLGNAEEREARTSRITGVAVAVVTNNKDPEGMGRVKLRFPWLDDNSESDWARMAVPMAGKGRGIYFLPEVGDEVLVAFDHGDVRFPYVIGALWNGKDTPPVKNDDGKNNIRIIQSRSGHVIRLTDDNGKEKIEIVDKSQKNSIVFDTSQNVITITSDNDISLSAPKGTIKLNAQKIEIKSSQDTNIESGAGMNVKATKQMKVKGATVDIN